jgi:Carboxypeptidase regulatory-like domain/TonB-dependent Receptor Plug Domain
MVKIKILMLMMVTFLLSALAYSQETTSEILGTVTDSNGGLAGATVVAVHLPSGTKYGTTTRQDGRYNLPNVKIGGPYTITVSFIGYTSTEQSDIVLSLGQAYTANFKLQEKSSQLQEVVVTATQDKVFNTNRTGMQETMSRDQITSLPTISRSWKDVVKLVPTQNNLSFGGISSQLNNVTVDGANFNNSFGLGDGTLGGQTGAQPISLDAVEQIQVNVSPFDVKYGGFNGGSINTVTRSGNNNLYASAYEYFKNKNLQGYNAGDITVPKQDYTYHLIGATVGGPIVKNKLFYFLNFEQESKTTPGTIWVASDANNPPDGTTVSNANAQQLDDLATFLKQTYGYDPGPYQGYSYTSKSQRLSAKIDWNINAKNTFTFKYNLLRSSAQIQASNSGAANTSYGRTPGQYAMPFFGSGYVINNNVDMFIGELNTHFSNSISNKLQIGYTRLRDFRKPLTSSAFPLVDILDGNGQPFTSFGYEQYTYNNLLNTNVYQLNDIITVYKGSHEISVGTQNSYNTYQNGFSPSYEGVYRFNSLADFYASAAGTAPAARYDLSYTLGGGSFPLVGPRTLELSAFIRDKWKLTENLTVNYGVRLDYTHFYNTFLYNPVVDTLTRFYDGIHANTGAAPKSALQISPRIGFNYDVLEDKSMQIRGGAGLFQGAPPFVWISNQASNSGMALFGSISNGQGYIFSPDVNAYRPTATAGLSKSYSINVTDPSYKFPQVLKSSLAVDKKIWGFTITAEGSYTANINASVFQNIALPSTGLITLSDGRIRYPVKSVYPISGIAQSESNPAIGNAIYMTNANAGYIWTGTLQIQKQMNNFYASIAYTRQVAKDAAVNGSTASTMWGSRPTTGNSNEFILGYSNNYLPHRIIGTLNYRKEYAKILASSIGVMYEASPNTSSNLSYVYNGDLNNDGFNNDLIYIPKNASDIKLVDAAPVGGVADTRTQDELWNQLDAFISQNPYLSKHRGQFAERQALVLPWTHRLDLNFTQDVKIKVKNSTNTLRFTADIYNLTNLLNKNWGVYKIPTTMSPLTFVKLDTDGKTPVFSFPYLDGVQQIPFTSPFKNDINTYSRYQIQIGIRYIFN